MMDILNFCLASHLFLLFIITLLTIALFVTIISLRAANTSLDTIAFENELRYGAETQLLIEMHAHHWKRLRSGTTAGYENYIKRIRESYRARFAKRDQTYWDDIHRCRAHYDEVIQKLTQQIQGLQV